MCIVYTVTDHSTVVDRGVLYNIDTKTLLHKAWNDMLRRREERAGQFHQTIADVLGEEVFSNNKYSTNDSISTNDGAQESKIPKIYLYSQQKLNFKVKAMDKLRSSIEKDHNATYTFSKDFVSQTVCVVDDESLKLKEKHEVQSKMLTSKGTRHHSITIAFLT